MDTVKFIISASLILFLMLSVYYVARPFIHPQRHWLKGFFILSEKPRECVSLKGYPEYLMIIPHGSKYMKYLAYRGNLSGMHLMKGHVENGTYECTLLMNVVNGTWITKTVKRNITYFNITVMK